MVPAMMYKTIRNIQYSTANPLTCTKEHDWIIGLCDKNDIFSVTRERGSFLILLRNCVVLMHKVVVARHLCPTNNEEGSNDDDTGNIREQIPSILPFPQLEKG